MTKGNLVFHWSYIHPASVEKVKLWDVIHPVSIHSSIFYIRLIQLKDPEGLEPLPAIIGREAGYTLDASPVNHRAT